MSIIILSDGGVDYCCRDCKHDALTERADSMVEFWPLSTRSQNIVCGWCFAKASEVDA